MALTHSSLIGLVKDEAQGFALRSLGELTSQRQSIEPAMARRLLMNLFSIRTLLSFAGAQRAVNLASALRSLLERFQFGEIARGRAVLDLARRVFSRLSDIAVNLESANRSRAVRTSDLEEELARMLNLTEIPQTTALLNVPSATSTREQLLPFVRTGHDEGRYITLAVMDLLQNGEGLPELLPILDSLSERGALLGCGLVDSRQGRNRRERESSVQQDIAFFLFRTEVPWDPSGSFSRLPAMKLATLFDPVSEGVDGSEWEPTVPKIDRELVTAALAGEITDASTTLESESTALVPVGQTDLAVLTDERSGDTGRRRAKGRREGEPRRTTVGFKLVFITSIVLVVSLTAMIIVASGFFRNDVTVRIEENNHTLAQVTALAVQRQFQSIVSSTQLFLNMVSRFSNVPDASQLLQNAYFAQNTGIAYIGIPGGVGFYNNTLLDGRQLHHTDIQNAIKSQQAALSAAGAGTTSVVNISIQLGTEMLAIVLPYRQANTQVPLVIVTTVKQFVQTVQTSGITQMYVVDARGHLIIDPDLTLLQGNVDYSNIPIVAAMMKSPIDNGELQYRNPNGVNYIGSFKRTTFGGVGVVAAAPAAKAFAAARAIERRNVYLEIVVLALSILVVYYFSKTITRPVGRLVEAARKVEGGTFLLDLKATTRDEIGLLTETFIQMGRGLSERERIKDAFGKFVSKTMAEQVLQEEVSLGGERKEVTIFFSDIRSFTAISESLQPEEVVEFLNDYMSRMVECVNETGGVVDKFIGDAIMAVWGVPVSHDNHAAAAIDGALMMRTALREFNRGRGTRGRPIIRIGCGINSGPVIAGQIGSTERMEYTVIGDAVNLASRIEALNKPFGTDILISNDTYEAVKDIYEVVPQLKIKVKGKSEPQQIYAVLGRSDDVHRPKTLRELQRLIGVDPASIKKQKAIKEEVKYEILDD